MRENPVRLGARWVLGHSRWVTLWQPGLEELAEELAPKPAPAWVGRYHFRGEVELTLRYLLVLDALNFCFWPPRGFPSTPHPLPSGERDGIEKPPLPSEERDGVRGTTSEKWSVPGPEGERLTGYYALSYALRRAAEDTPEFFEAERLAKVTADELRAVLGDIPLLPWRVAAAREVGLLLLRFGSAERFFSQARGSAQTLVELLTSHLPMFRDAAIYNGRWIPFYKRAQILVADVWGTFGGEGPGKFADLPWLTAFADYKLPQILWDQGAMRLHPALAERIQRGELIRWGSTEEVELRAATVVAVEELVFLLRKRGRDLVPFQVDWLLWNAAQGRLAVPHHRTLTWAY